METNPFIPVIVPAIIGGVCWVVSWRLWNRHAPNEKGAWGGAIAFALGFFAAHVLVSGWPPFPGRKAADWLPYLGLVAATLGTSERYWGRMIITRLPVMLIMSAALTGVILRTPLTGQWEGALWYAYLLVPTLIITVVWQALERMARSNPGSSIPLACWAWTACVGVACVFSASAKLGQLGGGLAAICGAAVVLAWWSPHLKLGEGAIAVLVPLVGGLLLQAYFFAEMPLITLLLLAAAPLVLLVGERRSIVYSAKWKAALLRLGLVLLPGLAAIGVAFVSYQRVDTSSKYNYYENYDGESAYTY